MLERGVARGEFEIDDMELAIYSIVAPMIFLIMTRHSMAACVPPGAQLDPLRYIESQAGIVLRGLCKRAKGRE